MAERLTDEELEQIRARLWPVFKKHGCNPLVVDMEKLLETTTAPILRTTRLPWRW